MYEQLGRNCEVKIRRWSLQSKDYKFSSLAYESGMGRSDKWEATVLSGWFLALDMIT